MIRSIRGRLAFWYLLVTFGSLSLLTGMVYYRARGVLKSDILRHATERVEEVSTAYETGRRSGAFADLDALCGTAGAVHEDLRYAVFDRTGRNILRTNAPAPSSATLAFVAAATAASGLPTELDLPLPEPREKSRFFHVIAQEESLPDGEKYVLTVAVSMRRIQIALNILVKSMLVVISVAVALALLGLWTLLTKSFRPIDALVEETRKLTAESLSRRLPLPGTKDEIHRLVLMLNEMIARLERSFANTRQFTMDASHELRTPLTAMKGEMELALMKGDEKEHARVLESNLEELNRLIDMVEKLLFLSRADMKEERLDARPVDVATLVQDVFELSQVLAATRGIAYTLAQDDPGALLGDASRLKQLLWNLIDNALKFTPSGGTVRITSSRKDGSVLLAVSDTGPGIPAEHQGRLFERFYRADAARSRQLGGCGLGLSIARWIARAHNGDITVASEPGKGSTFTFRAPALAGAATPAEARGACEEARTG
ncbi:MAG: hypothetical protein HYZ53_30810 [Planctomycetes bacterium]|nr:hypothetical protein [Planctomycetota bacterium]